MKITHGILSSLLIILITCACVSGVPVTGSGATPGTGVPVAAGTQLPGNLARISPANAGQVTQLARWGGGTLEQVVTSPHAGLLAVATSLGVDLLDETTLEQVRFINTQAALTCLAFSPDGRTIAAGAGDGSLLLLRVSDGKLLRLLSGQAAGGGLQSQRRKPVFGVG
jgi:WD40 repeat protein